MHPLPFPETKELKFSSVENSRKEITAEELKGLKIIDTLSNPYSFLISDNYSVSIAIRSKTNYDVYQLLTRSENNNKTLQEIGDPRNLCSGYLQITDKKAVRLDKSGNDELILKFHYATYCCPTCAVPLNQQAYEGYVIFDFDKLQVLEIATRSSIHYLSNAIDVEDWGIEFKKEYLKIGKGKYYYKNDMLVRK